MSSETLIILALLLPLAGAVGIALTGRISANLRETVTLSTASMLAVVVWSLLPALMNGERPGVTLVETRVAGGIAGCHHLDIRAETGRNSSRDTHRDCLHPLPG